MSDFPKGIFAYKPKSNAPDFIISDIVLDYQELGSWMKQNKDEQGKVRLQVLLSKDGSKYYVQKNDWKPKPQSVAKPKKEADPFDEDDDGLPF